MNEMAYVFQAWLPLIIWQRVDAPRYQRGFVVGSVIAALLIVTASATRFLHRRAIRQKEMMASEYAS